jgi:hypothetical protein
MRVEVQKTAIEKWNGALPTTIMTSGGAVPVLDVFKAGK